MMKKICSILLIAAILVGCNTTSNTNNNRIVLDLNSVSAIDTKAEVRLSDLGWNTEIIPLETSTEESYIRDITQIEESEDFFWIVADRKLFQFGSDGSFKGQVGRTGQGPEEYVAVQRISLDQKNKEIWIMDYFGRKMSIFTWDGTFARSFPLPEDYSFDNFYLSEDGQLYFLSMINAVMPDVLLYDPQTHMADTISYREREMGPEGFMGFTTMYELNGDTYLYHYFNDTVYTIQDNRLQPAWLLSASKMTYRFLEMEFKEDMTPTLMPDGPRIQIDKVMETPQYIFVFYKLDENNTRYDPNLSGEKKYRNLMAMYNKTDGTYYPHINIISKDKPWLSIKEGEQLNYSPATHSLFAVKEAEELTEYNVIKDLKYDDNPVIIRYILR